MPGTILLVTDDENFGNSLEALIERESYTVYTYPYKSNVLTFSESILRIDAVIFDFRGDNVETLAYAILTNSLLEKKHPKLIKIICVNDPRKVETEILNQVVFQHEVAIPSDKKFGKSILIYLAPIMERRNKKHKVRQFKKHFLPLSDLRESKESEHSKTTINVDISKKGIERLNIVLDKPVSLSELSMISELAPVAYIEKNFHGPKIDKAKVLGINRMKYTRLVAELNKNQNKKISTTINRD